MKKIFLTLCVLMIYSYLNAQIDSTVTAFVNKLVAVVDADANTQHDKSNTLGSQLFKNFHINWTTYKTRDYNWNRFGFGSAYGQSFAFEKRLTWKIGLDLDWAKYTLKYTGRYSYVNQKSTMNVTSFSVPLIVNYQAFNRLWQGLNFYTGPIYEQIIAFKSPQIESDWISHAQFGWTIGARYRFGAIFSVRLAYVHYFTGMFVNGDMMRSGIRFSVGF
ncbi:MAG: hypothetical protein FWF72_06695 [Paludibacter sp.]|nr:hypothetical protein [Paludibacter sp.]